MASKGLILINAAHQVGIHTFSMLVKWVGLRGGSGGLRGIWRRSARGTLLLALAVVALSLQTLRPICDVHFVTSDNEFNALFMAHAVGGAHAAYGSDRSSECCSSIEEGGAFVPLALMPAPGGSGALLVLSTTFFLLAGSGFLPVGPLRFAGTPPEVRRYHARSARILR